MIENLPQLEDDGLITPEVGPWAEQKYRLVWNYAKMFATSMRDKWDTRIYVDLYAGAGRSIIRGTSRIVSASPLLALDIPHQFDKYIFCENEPERFQALHERVKRNFPNVDASFIDADVTKSAEKIISAMPPLGKGVKVLSFCFIDPYKIKNFNFSLIRELSQRYIDFLILIPSNMDAHRNVPTYMKDTDTSISDFTGSSSWQEQWELACKKGMRFGDFIVDLFGQQMENLKYIYTGRESTVLIRSDDKNLPLYHLAFFSRNQLGVKFWKESVKYSSDQGTLF